MLLPAGGRGTRAGCGGRRRRRRQAALPPQPQPQPGRPPRARPRRRLPGPIDLQSLKTRWQLADLQIVLQGLNWACSAFTSALDRQPAAFFPHTGGRVCLRPGGKRLRRRTRIGTRQPGSGAAGTGRATGMPAGAGTAIPAGIESLSETTAEGASSLPDEQSTSSLRAVYLTSSLQAS